MFSQKKREQLKDALGGLVVTSYVLGGLLIAGVVVQTAMVLDSIADFFRED